MAKKAISELRGTKGIEVISTLVTAGQDGGMAATLWGVGAPGPSTPFGAGRTRSA